MAVLEDRRNRVWFRCHVEDGTPLEWVLIDEFSLCTGMGERAWFIGIYGPEASCYSTSLPHFFGSKSLAVCLAVIRKKLTQRGLALVARRAKTGLVCRSKKVFAE